MLDFLVGLPAKVKTLVDRLTSARAANLDNLDAMVSTRAAAATALSTTNWTNARAAKLDNLDAAISGIPVSHIKSVQQGSVYISGTGTSGATTIAAVNPSKAFIVFNGATASGGQNATERILGALVSVQLTNTNQVTCYRSPDGFAVSVTTNACFTVVELK